jgi:SOS-response transcriptional repressor LexA
MVSSDPGGERSETVPLTPMQYRFMRVLQDRLARNPDVGPTYAELMEDMGLRSKSGIARLVDECMQRGRITKLPNRDRSLVVLRPVGGDPARETAPVRLIRSFSDRELISEVQRRGLLTIQIPRD